MIFLTVGSSMPFDRLVAAVDELVGPARLDGVFAQIGASRYRPRHMEWVASLSKDDFDRRLGEARFIISHAGVGTIASALSHGKPVIVMPRQRAFGEVVNDHQVSTAERFGAAGHVLVARDAGQLRGCLADVAHFVPKPRTAHPDAVARRVGEFLRNVRNR